MESLLSQRWRRSPPDYAYTPIDVTSAMVQRPLNRLERLGYGVTLKAAFWTRVGGYRKMAADQAADEARLEGQICG